MYQEFKIRGDRGLLSIAVANRFMDILESGSLAKPVGEYSGREYHTINRMKLTSEIYVFSFDGNNLAVEIGANGSTSRPEIIVDGESEEHIKSTLDKLTKACPWIRFMPN